MASKSHTRFVIYEQGKAASILSIGLPRNGDVLIRLKSAEFFNERAEKSSIARDKAVILEQRYTIHPSPGSKTENIIQQTVTLNNGEILRPRQRTEALKKGKKFAHILTKRYQDTRNTRYQTSSENSRNSSLGNIDSGISTLVISVFVGSATSIYNIQEFADLNVRIDNFANVKLMLVWSFMQIPAHTTSMTIHSIVPPSVGSDQPQRQTTIIHPERGYDECIDLHRQHRRTLRDGFALSLRTKEALPVEIYNQILFRGAFKKFGDVKVDC